MKENPNELPLPSDDDQVTDRQVSSARSKPTTGLRVKTGIRAGSDSDEAPIRVRNG